MRKLLLSLTIIAGAIAVAPAAEAAPIGPIAQPIPVLDQGVAVQPVQYYYRGGRRYYRGRSYYHRRYYRRY